MRLYVREALVVVKGLVAHERRHSRCRVEAEVVSCPGSEARDRVRDDTPGRLFRARPGHCQRLYWCP